MQAERWQAAEDDRPYLRSSRRSYTALMVVIGIAALASAGYYWHYFSRSLPMLPSGTVPATVDAQTSPQPASVAAVPRVIPVPPEAATSLPSLENSDALLRRSTAGLSVTRPSPISSFRNGWSSASSRPSTTFRAQR